MRISGTMGQHSSASSELVISRLTDLKPRLTTTMHYAVESATIDRPGQLVIAIMGRMSAQDANTLLRLRRNRAQGLAIVLDVDTFADEPGTEQQRAQHELAGRILRDNQWRVIDVTRGMGVAQAWVGPRAAEQGGLMRAADRSGIAVMISLVLASLTITPLTEDLSFLGLSWLLILPIGGVGIALRRSAVGAGTVLGAQLVCSLLFSFGLGLTLLPDECDRDAVVRPLRRSLGGGYRAHAHPGLADGARRRREADLRDRDRPDHDHDRSAGLGDRSAGLGDRPAGHPVSGAGTGLGH